MQWLIDLVIEAIGIPPCSIWRGAFMLADWTIGDFTTDDALHELDLSEIVPKGATAVLFRLAIMAPVVYAHFTLQHPDVAFSVFTIVANTQVANVAFTYNCVMLISSDRKIKYKADNIAWTTISMAVEGWWK